MLHLLITAISEKQANSIFRKTVCNSINKLLVLFIFFKNKNKINIQKHHCNAQLYWYLQHYKSFATHLKFRLVLKLQTNINYDL